MMRQNVCMHFSRLTWPIFERFSRYVENLPDGQILARGGAEIGEDTYSFEFSDAVGADLAPDGGVLEFRGDLRFAAHHGMLFVMIADPVIDLGHGVVTILDPSAWPSRDVRLTIATLGDVASLSGGGFTARAFLAAQGTELFNSAYPLGTELDRLAVHVG